MIDETLFNFEDPKIEEIDEEDFALFKKGNKGQDKKGNRKYFKSCNTCGFEGYLLNKKQFLCPKCGFGMSQEPLEPPPSVPNQEEFEEFIEEKLTHIDVVTDMETDTK